MLHLKTAEKLRNYYSNVVQKSKQGVQKVTHLFTLLQWAIAQNLHNYYSNVVQKLK